MYGTWDRKDFAAHLGGETRCDQGPRGNGGFDHQGTLAQARDDPVALRKIGRQRWGAERVFAHDGTALAGDAVGEIVVAPGVHTVQTGSHHRDGRRANVQRTFVRSAIHTQGQTRDDAKAGLTQRGRELAGVDLPLRRGISAAYDSDFVGLRQRRQLTDHIQHQRRVCHLQQRWRKTRIAQRQQVVVSRCEPLRYFFNLGVEVERRDLQCRAKALTHHSL